MKRLKIAYRAHQPDLVLAWGAATVLVLLASLLVEALL